MDNQNNYEIDLFYLSEGNVIEIDMGILYESLPFPEQDSQNLSKLEKEANE